MNYISVKPKINLRTVALFQAGDYVVTIMDHFGADFSVLFVAACECVAVMWVYGTIFTSTESFYNSGISFSLLRWSFKYIQFLATAIIVVYSKTYVCSLPTGARRFMRDVEYMLGYPPRPKLYWLFCWIICSPILITVRIVYIGHYILSNWNA